VNALQTIGGLRKSWFIGREKLDFQFVLTFAAYNLIRMRNLGGGLVLRLCLSRWRSAWQTLIAESYIA
jgi:hypothetical protein